VICGNKAALLAQSFTFAAYIYILLKASNYITDLSEIARSAGEKEEENDRFLCSLSSSDGTKLDAQAHKLNNTISAAIDCTACGNCCKTLVINVAADEIAPLANHLNLTEAETKQVYIEESLAGNYFINTMPCHFLADNKCTIYAARFTECRDFPHLHKPGFKDRLPGTLMHYGRCPIIYNVIEAMKIEVGFIGEVTDQRA
jgi:Fe-S-cluster containining protein